MKEKNNKWNCIFNVPIGLISFLDLYFGFTFVLFRNGRLSTVGAGVVGRKSITETTEKGKRRENEMERNQGKRGKTFARREDCENRGRIEAAGRSRRRKEASVKFGRLQIGAVSRRQLLNLQLAPNVW